MELPFFLETVAVRSPLCDSDIEFDGSLTRSREPLLSLDLSLVNLPRYRTFFDTRFYVITSDSFSNLTELTLAS